MLDVNNGSNRMIDEWGRSVIGGVYSTESGRLINNIFSGELQHILEDNIVAQRILCACGRAAAQLCGAPRYFECVETIQ